MGNGRYRMKNHYKIFLSIFILCIIGFLFYSTWYQWEGHQETAYERFKPNRPIAELNNGNKVNTLAISPKDTNIIVSAGQGNDIKVWHRDKPDTPIQVLFNHPINEDNSSTNIESVFFDSSGNLLISRSFWMVAFWDVSTWELISSYRIPSSIGAVSPSENLLATRSLDIDIWDFTNPMDIKKIYKLENDGDHSLFISAEFSVNGRWLALKYLISRSTTEISKKKVHIWDLKTKKLHRTLGQEIVLDKTSNSEKKEPVMVVSDRGIKHSNLSIDKDDIRTVSFSPDNRFFAIGNSFGFRIWSLPDWRIYHQVDNVYVIDLAFSSNRRIFAISSISGIMIWSIDEMKPLAVLKGNRRLSSYYNIMFTPDGKSLIGYGYGDMIGVWDMETIK